MTDYFMAEQPIVDCLKGAIEEVSGRVLTISDMASILEEQQKTPAIHVLPGGDILSKSGSDGQGQTFEQIWVVVLAIKNAKDQKSGDILRETSGPIIWKILQTLQGFVPVEGFCGPLHRYASSEPVYQAGFAYFPLAFTTRMTI